MNLIDQIQTIATENELEVGLAFEHVESGEQANLNGQQLFPMASVLKIPVLVHAFRLWDAGHFRLEDRWTLTDEAKRRGSGILPFFGSGVSPTVVDLLTLMMIISDNTATDMVLERIGGPAAVEQAMRDLGLADIHLKLTIQELLQACIPAANPDLDSFAQQKVFHQQGFIRDSISFQRTPENDVSTATAMTSLVAKLFRGEVASQPATDHMMTILGKQQFNTRLPRFFPPGTPFYHKTGTLGSSRNDSGLLTINADNHVAITLYVVWDDAAVWDDPVATNARIFAVETAMGQIGRLIFDYYTR